MEEDPRRLDVVGSGPGGSPGGGAESGGPVDGEARAAAGRRAARLRARARELGFDQVGIAPAEAPPHGDWLRAWVDRGWHGAMSWMAREDTVRRRLSPEEALSGCRSVVMVSMSYAGGEDDPAARGGGDPAWWLRDAEGYGAPEGAPTAPGPGAGDGPGRGNAAGDRDRGDRRGPSEEAVPGPGAPRPPDPLAPVVARYARGRDYHGVFEERLEALSEAIRELDPDAEVLPYVDYGPVMERDHAQRAGLGWVGKNTCLIDPELGSWLLLGAVLTTLELPPDEPFTADRCGSCTRCIEACPTDAIRGPRELDARRCISYLTIELQGAIPEELRPKIGNRVFGCDICQEVCPWNRDAPARDHPDFRPGKPVEHGTMIEWARELLALDEEGFEARYGDTALERPGREALLRNLCVGLGNSGRREAAPVLERCAEEGSALVREHAEWALRQLRGEG